MVPPTSVGGFWATSVPITGDAAFVSALHAAAPSATLPAASVRGPLSPAASLPPSVITPLSFVTAASLPPSTVTPLSFVTAASPPPSPPGDVSDLLLRPTPRRAVHTQTKPSFIGSLIREEQQQPHQLPRDPSSRSYSSTVTPKSTRSVAHHSHPTRA